MSCGHPHETPCSDVHDLLDQYVDAELDQQRRAALAQHFEECPGCDQEYVLVTKVKVRLYESCCASTAPERLRMMIITRLRSFGPSGDQ